jgi:NDP-sugar pyrophosphorylase family protein
MHKESKPGTTALVFCGGEGTRMEPMSSLIRKEMLPIGPQLMPLLANIVEHLVEHGIKDIVFMSGRKNSDYDIVNFFGDGRRFNVNVRYFADPPKCRGTGHALLWAVKKLNLKGRNLIIYYGDMYNTINLKMLLETHATKNVAATIAVSDRYIIPKGLATVSRNGMVLKVEEKPRWRGPEKITVGLLCLNVDKFVAAFKSLPSTVSQLEKSKYRDVMRDIIGDLVNQREVAYYLSDAYWQDIGSFQDYRIVNKALLNISKNVNAQKEKKKLSAETGPSVFLSYRISKENQAIVEGVLSRILKAMKFKVVSGAKLDRTSHVSGSPSSRAYELIDMCDLFIAIATPVGSDGLPSSYVIDEVTHAKHVGKDVKLFVEKNTKVPGHWKEQFVYTGFDIAKSAEFVRDVVEILEGID